MAVEYVLDLGEDGRVVVVASEPFSYGDIVEAGSLDAAKEFVRIPLENVKASIASKLNGMGKLFLSALPLLDDRNFKLDEFTVEFELGIGAEFGGDTTASTGVPAVASAAAGATIKVMPHGTFKCTYTWKRYSQT